MKTKLLLNSTIFMLLISINLNAGRLSYGFKTGFNYNKLNYKKGAIYELKECSYPPGFQLGVYSNTKFTNNFSFINEINFLKLNSKALIMDDTDIIKQNINMLYIDLPILLQYAPPLRFVPYLFGGPCLGYLIQANYSADAAFSNLNTYDGLDITKELPSFNLSLEFGAGKTIKISTIFFLFEIKGQIWITKYKLPFTPEWTNKSIQFLFGSKF